MESSFNFTQLAQQHEFGSTVRKFTEVQVTIRVFNELIVEFARGIHKAYEIVVPTHLADTIPDVDAIAWYLEMLVDARMVQCTEGRLPMKARSREWVIPHVFFAALGFIGKVHNTETLIDIIPVVEPQQVLNVDSLKRSDANPFISTELKQFRDVAQFFVSMEDFLPVAYGLPASNDGNYEFMMFQVVENKLMHYMDKVDPATALVASFIQAQSSQKVFANRFCYGDVVDAYAPIRELLKYHRKR